MHAFVPGAHGRPNHHSRLPLTHSLLSPPLGPRRSIVRPLVHLAPGARRSKASPAHARCWRGRRAPQPLACHPLPVADAAWVTPKGMVTASVYGPVPGGVRGTAARVPTAGRLRGRGKIEALSQDSGDSRHGPGGPSQVGGFRAQRGHVRLACQSDGGRDARLFGAPSEAIIQQIIQQIMDGAGVRGPMLAAITESGAGAGGPGACLGPSRVPTG
jgi:hypothetical protein